MLVLVYTSNYMRKRLLYIFAIICVIAGCNDSVQYNPEEFYPSLVARYLRVSPKEFSLDNASATSRGFQVATIDTPWGFTEVMDWIDLSQMSGSQNADIEMSVSQNMSGENERLGIFYLESKALDWTYNIPLSVYQPAATPYATPETNNITFSGAIGSQEIKVNSNCTWTCTDDVEWLSVVKNNDSSSLIITVTENLTNASRTTNVTLYLNSRKLSTISVSQKAAEVTLETNTLTYENTAGAYEIRLISEASWSASTSQNWIEVSPSSGDAGETKLKISALENSSVSDRSGYVYIQIGNSQVVEIPVFQRGLYIEFYETELDFISDEDEKTIRINSNTSWSIDSCPEWMSISPMSGTGSYDLSIKVQDNPNVTSRDAKIIVSQAGLSLSSELNVTQAGKSFEYGQSVIECSDKEQEIKVNVTTTGKWTAISNDTWLTVSPASMTGSSELILNLEENVSDNSRTGNITLTIGNKEFTISVIQAGKYFTIDYGVTAFGSIGATLSIEVSTNDSWTAKVENNASWISLSQTSGYGDASFDATIADNPSVNKRSSVITLSTVNNKSLKIPVEQAARYMTVDHQNITFFAVGGTSEDITISTDGKYSITCSASWFSATEKGDGVFNVTAQENTTKEVREGTLTIAMTDLKEGTYSITIPVFQSADGASFIVIGYDDDKNWDIGATASVSLTVTGYGTDKNWDSNPQTTGLTVTVTGYVEDKNWDSQTTSSGSVSYQGYSGDNNWNN